MVKAEPIRHKSRSDSLVDEDLSLRNILDSTFRVNPAFKLIAHEDLSPEQRHSLAALAEDPEHFGVLISGELPALGVLAVNHDSASLFSELLEPDYLPDHVHDPMKIAGLVLDGILELEWNGRYVTGPGAYYSLFTQRIEEPDIRGRISALSVAALKLVQELQVKDPRAISDWLYGYNRLPMSPSWARKFAGPEQIDSALGLQPGRHAHNILNDNFVLHEIPGWRSWQSLNNELMVDDDEPTFKLYISLHPNGLIEAFPTIVGCFAEVSVPSFKLGMDVFGILRPDKLIAYFSDYSSLEAVANLLTEVLSGFPAHGVPFTAAITDDGLLSWGMDPPYSDQIPGWQGIESWRVWVTNRLARSIIRARVLGGGGLEPWQYALIRLQVEGVQPWTWLPKRAIAVK